MGATHEEGASGGARATCVSTGAVVGAGAGMVVPPTIPHEDSDGATAGVCRDGTDVGVGIGPGEVAG